MIDVLYLRGFLAPGGHVVWAAMSGAAIMIVKRNQNLNLNMLADGRFIRIFLIPVVLHALWDWSLPNEMFGDGLWNVVLIVAAWIVTIAFINRGLKEVIVYKS